MKYSNYLFLLFLLSASFTLTTKAQCPGCVIDLNCTANPVEPTLCPASLPDGELNAPYDQNVTFYMPAQFQTQGVNVTLNQITVLSITGVPPGLNWQTSATGNVFYPSANPPTTERGCVKICGTPTAVGQYNIVVAVLADVNTPFGNMSQNSSFTLPITILPPPGGNASFTYNPSFGCAPLDVAFEGIIQAQPMEITNYNWNFNNGVTSQQQIPSVQTFASPATYLVSLNTKKYRYRLSSVTVTATGTNWCGDTEEPNIFGCTGSPDLFFDFTNNGSTQSVASVSNQQTATFSNLSFLLYDPTLSLQFWDEDVISTNDNLGITLQNITAAGTYNFNTSEVIGSFIVDTVFTEQFNDIDTVIVNPSPQTPVITASGNTSFCAGDSLLLTVNPAIGNTVQWYLNDTTYLIGETFAQLTVNTAGNYAVAETNSFACSTISASESIAVFPLPAAPNLFVIGGSINSSGATGALQWFFNGNPIAGATVNNLLYADTGYYMLQVTNANGCTNAASVHITTPSGVINNYTANGITVFPNPTADVLYVNLPATEVLPVSILITDLRGAVVETHSQLSIDKGKLVLPVDLLSNGTYVLFVRTNSGSYTHKFSILRQ